MILRAHVGILCTKSWATIVIVITGAAATVTIVGHDLWRKKGKGRGK
jgi:hypothetical protein